MHILHAIDPTRLDIARVMSRVNLPSNARNAACIKASLLVPAGKPVLGYPVVPCVTQGAVGVYGHSSTLLFGTNLLVWMGADTL